MTRLVTVKKSDVIAFIFCLVTLNGAIGVPSANATGMCGAATTETLLANHTMNAGIVMVENDEDYLYVTYTTDNGWYLSKAHLHVADSLAGIPVTREGSPKAKNFSHERFYDPAARANTDTYIIPKEALSLDNNNSAIIAAHAFLVRLDGGGNVIANEAAWAQGSYFTDRGNWAMYLQYSWQPCNGDDNGISSTKASFAFSGGTNALDGDQTTCFLEYDLDLNDQKDFDHWGWSNGPLTPGSYVFDIYAAASHCDVAQGTLVGTLAVDYAGSAATVTYQMYPPYTLVETHLYLGSDYLPKTHGEYTIAPGQYPSLHRELANVHEDIYKINNLSGDIYVAAHGTVAGF